MHTQILHVLLSPSLKYNVSVITYIYIFIMSYIYTYIHTYIVYIIYSIHLDTYSCIAGGCKVCPAAANVGASLPHPSHGTTPGENNGPMDP